MTPTAHRIAIIALLTAAAGCDGLWPLEGKYDPRRCDPACPGGQVCISGKCRSMVADALLDHDAGVDAPVPDAPLSDQQVPDAPGSDAPLPDQQLPDAPLLDQQLPDAPPLDKAADKAVPDAPVPDAPVADAFVLPGTWIKVTKGTFTMGSPSSEPCREPYNVKETQHSVTLSQGFYISDSEVTQAQFSKVMGYNPSAYKTICGASCPVESVTWHEAVSYCNTLSVKAGLTPCFTCTSGDAGVTTCTVKAAYTGQAIYACKGYRLPTEAEWEYAYRAKSTTALYKTAATSGALANCTSADTELDKIAWYKSNASGMTHPVKQKLPNAWGLYDMAGNVDEWCHDWYQKDLGSTAMTNPVNTFDGTNVEQIERGGSFDSLPQFVRAANRWAEPMTKTFSGIGFRCVRSAP